MRMLRTLVAALAGILATSAFAETQLTIATVNNSDMIIMQRLSKQFEAAHPDIKLNWVVLEENVLRERVTTDIATKGGGLRHPDHRDLRDADLGQEGLAGALRRPAGQLRRATSSSSRSATACR